MNATFMTEMGCIGLVFTMAIAIVALVARHVGGRAARRLGAALAAWLIYAGVLSYLGVVGNARSRPPGIVFVVVPVLVYVVAFVVRLSKGPRLVAVSPALLIALQTFRVGVELVLHQLGREQIIPTMLTFEGANVDIFIGASAPVAAWLSTRGRSGLKFAYAWNVVGLAVLANVVVRAVLTTPGPLNFVHAEVPNQMFGTFPFTFVPAFFVPLALSLHALAMRSIGARLREVEPGSFSPRRVEHVS